MRGHIINILLAGALLLPSVARAQDGAETPAVSIAYNAALVSDYRFRGISYTTRHPAVQVGADLTTRSGWFLGTWWTNVSDYGTSNLEIDLYGGYGGSVAGFDYSATLYTYVYPGGVNTDYYELQGTIARTIGPVTSTLTLAYTPNQWNTDRDNLYVALGSDVALGQLPLTASFSVGRENGSYDHKWDWSAGLTYKLDALDLSATYVDSNYKGALEAGKNARAGVVLSAKASF
ncbi:TorF family putative porin [Rhizorhabdus wittichii]|jgi:uncharacterized protein (TIGR02001 family)|uniref:Porin n=1 Tax=Rhizorhabdus wittichii (strain DSM 6014 / CCUG 31198 / JCM 15750 / NBRC 105917 / EY 4224 / RW1) TaxID=392499 RepID=A0A9J9HA54_RHIWR|nr:TorF family putative porin [Rhizorhabdus wittichii]ABQ67845.1 hypothetical protein Swit_1482 [Rhizorhabdus wittichii RW1]ARR55402.1 hypothetical protein HY78_19140 [Rhizorhabdus wittichii DC-6]